MAGLKSVFVLVLASIFRLGWTDIDWSSELCSLNDSVHLKSGRPLPLELFPSGVTPSMNGSKLECPCQFETCLSICCPDEKARYNGNCIKDSVASDGISRIRIIANNGEEREVSTKNFHPLFRNPCNFDWMAIWQVENFSLLENGSIRGTGSEEDSLWDFQHYCLFREPDTAVYLAKVCRPWLKTSKLEILWALLITFVMLAIFIVYTVVPDLRNLHGAIFRAYVGTYIAMLMATLGILITNKSRTYAHWYTFFENIGHSCSCSCVLWFNVMSFNIWRTFRGLRLINFATKEQENKEFVRYGIYAWGTPTLVLTIVLPIVKYCLDDSWLHALQIWISLGMFTVIYASNVFFYISTALRIRQHKVEIANLTNGVNKHHNIDEHWQKLYAKLFLIRGGHSLAWMIWLLLPTFVNTQLLGMMELIQAILIFIIFVWKDNIRHALRERFVATPTESRNQWRHWTDLEH